MSEATQESRRPIGTISEVLEYSRTELLDEIRRLRDERSRLIGESNFYTKKITSLEKNLRVATDRERDACLDRDLYRDHLRDALKKLKRPPCGTCDGSGGVEVFAGPTPMDEVVVGWTDPKEESCDDCCGSGRDLV